VTNFLAENELVDEETSEINPAVCGGETLIFNIVADKRLRYRSARIRLARSQE